MIIGMKQQQAHWLHTEVPMMSDVNDWKQNLTETEKNIIGSILKGFAQTETVVNDYWSTLVTSWFRKPEVINGCNYIWLLLKLFMLKLILY